MFAFNNEYSLVHVVFGIGTYTECEYAHWYCTGSIFMRVYFNNVQILKDTHKAQ